MPHAACALVLIVGVAVLCWATARRQRDVFEFLADPADWGDQ